MGRIGWDENGMGWNGLYSLDCNDFCGAKKQTPGLIKYLHLICSSWFSRHIWCTRSGTVAWPIHLSQGGLLWPASSRLDHVSNIIETPQEGTMMLLMIPFTIDQVHKAWIYNDNPAQVPSFSFHYNFIILNFLWYHWKLLLSEETRIFIQADTEAFPPVFPRRRYSLIC